MSVLYKCIMYLCFCQSAWHRVMFLKHHPTSCRRKIIKLIVQLLSVASVYIYSEIVIICVSVLIDIAIAANGNRTCS